MKVVKYSHSVQENHRLVLQVIFWGHYKSLIRTGNRSNSFLFLGKVTPKLGEVLVEPEAKIQNKTNGRKYKILYVYIRLILIHIIFLIANRFMSLH